jgi:hypothetical protein
VMPAIDRDIQVRIIGMPLDIYRKASEHFNELKREFTFLRDEKGLAVSAPQRLLDVSHRLSTRYRGFTTTPNTLRDEAMSRGDKAIDLTYEVPPSVKDACIELIGLLEEADEYCRSGEHLLTLAAPPDVVHFRRWFLEEFVRQVDGAEPRSWADYSAEQTT